MKIMKCHKRIMKIKKILERNASLRKIMKIQELDIRTTKIKKNIRMRLENHENHENPKIS